MQIAKRNNFPAAVLNRKITIDGNEIQLRVYLNEHFFKTRNADISADQVRSIVDMEVNESINIGTHLINRIT